jgi:hypothetical protein
MNRLIKHSRLILLLGNVLMDHNMVLIYDYSSQNRRRWRTNLPQLRAISMAMAGMVQAWVGHFVTPLTLP